MPVCILLRKFEGMEDVGNGLKRTRLVKASVQSRVRVCNFSGGYGMCLASGAEGYCFLRYDAV
jgi:hypothetical protein